ncbi:DNA repair protein RecO [Gryllotalpicola sp.]|uniref:DNA repair protein RecO n=1 Tax=Gryllotalpicola sp. TaxID=1932787 RepID=UPI00260CA7C5|nr:DNA repair protein RecO [Gryllotalpicola sp.]
MPTYRDEAVVLRTYKLGEADRIITLLSKQHGKIRAVAKGVRRTASKFGSRLEPFMVADIQFHEGRSLDVVQQAETLGSYGADIVGDYASYTAANAMVEAVDRLTEDDGSRQQYLLLVGALRSLARREHAPALSLDSYLVRALAIAGWAPSFGDCARCSKPGPHSHVVVQLGGVVCDDCAPPGAPKLDGETLALLTALLTGDWASADSSAEAARGTASGIIAAYTQWHLERGLRSLRLVSREAEANAHSGRQAASA